MYDSLMYSFNYNSQEFLDWFPKETRHMLFPHQSLTTSDPTVKFLPNVVRVKVYQCTIFLQILQK